MADGVSAASSGASVASSGAREDARERARRAGRRRGGQGREGRCTEDASDDGDARTGKGEIFDRREGACNLCARMGLITE